MMQHAMKVRQYSSRLKELTCILAVFFSMFIRKASESRRRPGEQRNVDHTPQEIGGGPPLKTRRVLLGLLGLFWDPPSGLALGLSCKSLLAWWPYPWRLDVKT